MGFRVGELHQKKVKEGREPRRRKRRRGKREGGLGRKGEKTG